MCCIYLCVCNIFHNQMGHTQSRALGLVVHRLTIEQGKIGTKFNASPTYESTGKKNDKATCIFVPSYSHHAPIFPSGTITFVFCSVLVNV